jgi:putative addiction module killer protein
MEVQPKKIQNYVTSEGKVPFEEWFLSLSSEQVQNKIESRLLRVKNGNLGDYKSVGGGVCELRIDFGPGYRIYFGQDGKTIILLLCGGDKSTQTKDITEAKVYWSDYENCKKTTDN